MKENIDSKRQRLEELYNELDSLQEAFNRTLAAQSWATRDGMSSRDVTNPDLADLASDELVEILGEDNMSPRLAEKVIMKARELAYGIVPEEDVE